MKLKNEIQTSVEQLNCLFNEKLKSINYNLFDQNNFITFVSKAKDEFTNSIFGEVGKNLNILIKKIDKEHPELSEVYDGIFSCKKPYFNKIKDLYEIKKILKNKKILFLDCLLSDLSFKDNDLNLFLEILKKFILNKPPVRLLKNICDRTHIRNLKKIQKINLEIFYNKGQQFLNSIPDNFLNYLRFESLQQIEIDNLKNKVERYKEIGCNFLAFDLQKSIEEHLGNYKKQYYGFNRISLTTSAIIMAKFLGYEVNLGKFHISSALFENYWKCQHMFLEYEPKIYPYRIFENTFDFSDKVCAYLESMPDVNNKPIFDYYSVLVPSANIEEELEIELVKSGILKSILFGEKDGMFYFICFLN